MSKWIVEFSRMAIFETKDEAYAYYGRCYDVKENMPKLINIQTFVREVDGVEYITENASMPQLVSVNEIDGRAIRRPLLDYIES